MLTQTLLTVLLASTTAFSLPHLPKREPTYTTNATYYQGGSSTSTCGFEAVSTGNITSGVCNIAYTYSLSIQPLAERDCEYVLWKGSSDCGVDGAATEKENTFLPAGGYGVCVTTGVYDGGEHVHASGRLDCGGDVN